MDFDTAVLLSFPVIFLIFLALERLIGGGRVFPKIRYAAPANIDVPVGFEPERSRRWLAMLACIDVNATQGRLKL